MNKQRNVSFKLLALAALLLFLAGCASASTPTPTPASLVGTTWEATIAEEEAPVFKGHYEVSFTENGRTLVFGPTTRGPTDLGSYTVAQDQLLVLDERSECVKLGFPTATWKWSVENDTLVITAMDDRCYSRHEIVERTWTKKTSVETPGPTLKPMLK